LLAPLPILPALEKEAKHHEEPYTEIRVEKKEKDSDNSELDIGT